MKKFTENTDDKIKPYANNLKLHNDIYDLIDKTLIPKIDGKKSDKISLTGKEKFVEEIIKLIENEINKTKISLLKEYKMIQYFLKN